MAEPDPLRLTWRALIKKTLRGVVLNPLEEPIQVIEHAVAEEASEGEQAAVTALIVEELRRLHEGVPARYGLRPAEYHKWKQRHDHAYPQGAKP